MQQVQKGRPRPATVLVDVEDRISGRDRELVEYALLLAQRYLRTNASDPPPGFLRLYREYGRCLTTGADVLAFRRRARHRQTPKP